MIQKFQNGLFEKSTIDYKNSKISAQLQKIACAKPPKSGLEYAGMHCKSVLPVSHLSQVKQVTKASDP